MGHQLTKEDIEKMKEEIEYRTVTLRPELLEDVKTARAHGDLSENFEYHAAKREKNKNESRIRYLEKMIKTAEIIEEDAADDVVSVNKTVTLYFEDDCCEEKMSIVTTVFVNVEENRVSVESPVGKALMNHKIGERVEVKLDNGFSYYVVIKSIEPFNEDLALNQF